MKRINYLITFALCLFSLLVQGQSDEESKFTDSDTISLYSDDNSGLEGLKGHLLNNQVFISGENHTYTESNARLWLKMIKYLHAEAGVRNVIFEYGYAYGWLVNEYLQTGDTVVFNAVKHMAYIEYSNAIEDLREFNEGLDSSEKIQLFGIDIDRGVYPILKMLDHLIPDDVEADDSIAMHLETIKSLAYYNEEKLREEDEEGDTYFAYKTTPTLLLIQKNFKAHEAAYQEVLGDQFDLFKDLITKRFDARQLWAEYESDKAAQQYVYRERYMYKEFIDLSSENSGKWFGQFGRCHTTRTKVTSNACEWYMFRSLANRMDKSNGSPFKDSVLTMAIAYKGDHSQGTEWADFQDNLTDYFDDVPKNSIVLLDIADDEELQDTLGEDFDFIFLNTNTNLGEDYADIADIYAASGVEDFSVRSSMFVDFGTRSISVTGINAMLNSPEYTDQFGAVFNVIGGALEYTYVIQGKDRIVTGFEYGVFRAQKIIPTYGYDASLTLKGDYFKMSMMYDLIPSSVLDLTLGTSFNYENLSLRAVNIEVGGDVSEGVIDDYRVSEFNNPAFSMDLRAGAGLKLGVLKLGVLAGQSFDFSKKYFKAIDGTLLDNGPETSLTGNYLLLRAGLSF